MTEEYSLLTLFVSAFISSTLLPGGSEAILLYLASQDGQNLWILWLVASLGNTLGGLTSWGVGRWIAWKFPQRTLSEKKHERALLHIRRWGPVSLLFSWLPIIGDPLCLVAGWLKISFYKSMAYIAVGKALRYAVLVMFVDVGKGYFVDI